MGILGHCSNEHKAGTHLCAHPKRNCGPFVVGVSIGVEPRMLLIRMLSCIIGAGQIPVPHRQDQAKRPSSRTYPWV